MHFSSASAAPGDQAFLESRWLYPKPGAQCLQFFLHNSGAADDVLNILVRDSDGKLTLVKSISGSGLKITFCFWPSGWTHFLKTSKQVIDLYSLFTLQEMSRAPGNCTTSTWMWRRRPAWCSRPWGERIHPPEVSLWTTSTCRPWSVRSTSGTSATSPAWWPPRLWEGKPTALASCHRQVTPSR